MSSSLSLRSVADPVPGSVVVWAFEARLVPGFAALLVLVLSFAPVAPASAQTEGVPPTADGRTLNLDFESSSLEDWTAEGNAFADQPVQGDAFANREVEIIRSLDAVRAEREQDPLEVRSGHQGEWWVTSVATEGPKGQGTLTSRAFEVVHPYASFYISGGAFESTRAELVRVSDNEVIFQVSGTNDFELRPVVVDLSDHVGEQIFIRLVDHDTGASTAAYIPENPHAHVNFDHFRFHAERPTYENEIEPSEISALPGWDVVTHTGLSGEEAAAAMELPDGFSATLAAAEPDVINPIAFAIDARGRLWVAEAHTYPIRAEEGEGQDRILIFEDTDGDGTLDSRKVFMEGLNLISGIEVGFGGVWVGAAPYLMYIPIDESGDAPAGDPEILLDGWGYHDTHETLNSFSWGPDGWLYGTHGVFTHSNVGAPGTGEDRRVRLNAGLWRFHPQTHEFEVFTEGTSNPWGVDFNDYGHAFMTACVIPHLHHSIQGARIIRQAGDHFNPYVYDDLDHIGDHVHWVGDRGPHAGNRRSDAAGGGHAHAGAMFYQGDSWPEEYHGRLFMNNVHGFRANTDILEREGSGYVGRHGPDFYFANDNHSQMLDLQYGPDGSVYTIDWYDVNQCHHGNPESHDHSTGRIFKFTHENDEWVQVDLESQSSAELVELMLHPNEWYVRTARRILQHRGADSEVHDALWAMLDENPDVPRKLRALWALHVTDGVSDAQLVDLLDHDSEHVRSWAVQLLMEDREAPAEAITRLAEMAAQDDSPVVRLYVASALQRIEPEQRWDAVRALTQRAEDAGDRNMPLMTWYAMEPLVPADMNRAMAMALDAELPRILSFTVSRIADVGSEEALAILSTHLGTVEDAEKQAVILEGINKAVGTGEESDSGGE